jgi:hypothetical protein
MARSIRGRWRCWKWLHQCWNPLKLGQEAAELAQVVAMSRTEWSYECNGAEPGAIGAQ